jgi:hypothetical protein
MVRSLARYADKNQDRQLIGDLSTKRLMARYHLAQSVHDEKNLVALLETSHVKHLTRREQVSLQIFQRDLRPSTTMAAPVGDLGSEARAMQSVFYNQLRQLSTKGKYDVGLGRYVVPIGTPTTPRQWHLQSLKDAKNWQETEEMPYYMALKTRFREKPTVDERHERQAIRERSAELNAPEMLEVLPKNSQMSPMPKPSRGEVKKIMAAAVGQAMASPKFDLAQYVVEQNAQLTKAGLPVLRQNGPKLDQRHSRESFAVMQNNFIDKSHTDVPHLSVENGIFVQPRRIKVEVAGKVCTPSEPVPLAQIVEAYPNMIPVSDGAVPAGWHTAERAGEITKQFVLKASPDARLPFKASINAKNLICLHEPITLRSAMDGILEVFGQHIRLKINGASAADALVFDPDRVISIEDTVALVPLGVGGVSRRSSKVVRDPRGRHVKVVELAPQPTPAPVWDATTATIPSDHSATKASSLKQAVVIKDGKKVVHKTHEPMGLRMVYVSPVSGGTSLHYIPQMATGVTLKHYVKAMFGYPVEQLKLTLNGHIVDDDIEYHIEPESVIRCGLLLPGGTKNAVRKAKNTVKDLAAMALDVATGNPGAAAARAVEKVAADVEGMMRQKKKSNKSKQSSKQKSSKSFNSAKNSEVKFVFPGTDVSPEITVDNSGGGESTEFIFTYVNQPSNQNIFPKCSMMDFMFDKRKFLKERVRFVSVVSQYQTGPLPDVALGIEFNADAEAPGTYLEVANLQNKITFNAAERDPKLTTLVINCSPPGRITEYMLNPDELTSSPQSQNFYANGVIEMAVVAPAGFSGPIGHFETFYEIEYCMSEALSSGSAIAQYVRIVSQFQASTTNIFPGNPQFVEVYREGVGVLTDITFNNGTVIFPEGTPPGRYLLLYTCKLNTSTGLGTSTNTWQAIAAESSNWSGDSVFNDNTNLTCGIVTAGTLSANGSLMFATGRIKDDDLTGTITFNNGTLSSVTTNQPVGTYDQLWIFYYDTFDA